MSTTTSMTALDVTRAGDLRRMKAVATGLFLAATAVFVVARLAESNDSPGWVGYVRAAAEAGMVGALADWFAVTALFRHPLGIPIPHTAIIPTRKDALGEGLGDFVGENFLSEDAVRSRLAGVDVAARVGEWIARPANAERVTAELGSATRAAVAVLDDDDIQQLIQQVVVRKLHDEPVGPPLGAVLAGVVADGSHHRLVDLVVARIHDWITRNHDEVVRIVREHAPGWSPRFVDGIVADRVYREVRDFAYAVRIDRDHPLREAVDTFLAEFGADLQSDPDTIANAERIKHQVVDHPDVQEFIGRTWGTAKALILDAADDPDSDLRRRVRDGLVAAGTRLAGDAELRAKLDGWIADAAAYVVNHYRHEITTLITDTIAKWDAQETARKIELQVGRDLQFIRINGTIVGALAGLGIHTFSQIALT